MTSLQFADGSNVKKKSFWAYFRQIPFQVWGFIPKKGRKQKEERVEGRGEIGEANGGIQYKKV